MQQVSLDEQDIRRIFKTDTTFGKFLKFSFRLVKQLTYLAVLFFVFFYLVNSSAFWKRLTYSLAAEKPVDNGVVTPPPPPVVEAPKPDYPPEIQIPKIGITAPIILEVPAADTVARLVDGVVQMQSTAWPGEVGNAVITGHSSDYPWSPGKFKNIFALLDKLVVGDEIFIPFKTQKLVYKVSGSRVVKASDVSVLRKTNTPTLTLITCYPVGTSRNRLIITADLVIGEPTGVQQIEPNISQDLPNSR